MSRQPPAQQPPPVQKLLVKYGKVGPARFASHRDFARAFERALRRAEVPMAFSSGFSPHPRLSYINPAATGAASWAEYLVIGLRQIRQPAAVMADLAAAMPAGFPILAVSPLVDAAVFEASQWQVDWPGAEPAGLATAIARFDAASAIEIVRQTKTGPRRFDVKPALVAGPALVVGGESPTESPTLTMVLRHTVPLVRPDDVAVALRAVAPKLPDVPVLATRLAQGTVADLTTG